MDKKQKIMVSVGVGSTALLLSIGLYMMYLRRVEEQDREEELMKSMTESEVPKDDYLDDYASSNKFRNYTTNRTNRFKVREAHIAGHRADTGNRLRVAGQTFKPVRLKVLETHTSGNRVVQQGRLRVAGSTYGGEMANDKRIKQAIRDARKAEREGKRARQTFVPTKRHRFLETRSVRREREKRWRNWQEQ